MTAALTHAPNAVSRAAVLLAFALPVVLLGVIYAETFRQLELRWSSDPSWSHGYLVLPACGLLLYQAWQRGGPFWNGGVDLRDTLVGLAAVVVGLGVHASASVTRQVSLDAVSLVLAVLGGLWICGGRSAAPRFAGAALFLLFMVPLPFSWQQPLAEALQHQVSVAAEAVLSLCGVTVSREGYLLLLPGQTLEVAEGCSGLRQVTVFLGMSVFLALRGAPRRGFGIALVLLSMPVALIANTLRVVLTGGIYLTLGPAWAQGFLHEVEGLGTCLVGLGMLWGAARWLSRLLDTGRRTGKSAHPTCDFETATRQTGGGLFKRTLSLRLRLGVLTAVLGAGACGELALQQAVAAVEQVAPVALRASLDGFPTNLGEWTGLETPVGSKSSLYGDEHLHRTYRNAVTGQTVVLWMIYTVDGRDRGHFPEVCMRAIGNTEVREQQAALAVEGHAAPVRRLYFRRPTDRAGQWVYHWYYVLPDRAVELGLPSWKRWLWRQRGVRSGLTLEVFAPEHTDRDAQAADDLMRQVDHAIQAWLPDTAVRGSRRGDFLLIQDGRFHQD